MYLVFWGNFVYNPTFVFPIAPHHCPNNQPALHTSSLGLSFQGANPASLAQAGGVGSFHMLLNLFNILPTEGAACHRDGHQLLLPDIFIHYI